MIDLEGGYCHCCGFMEDGLVACRDIDGRVTVSCQECYDQASAEFHPGLVVAYLPEMPRSAFSHYVRMLAFLTFAARADAINGHDFSDGSLPPRFRRPEGWAAPLKWRTLSEGLKCSEADHQSLKDLAHARRAFEFLKSRIEYANHKDGSTPFADMLATDAYRAKRDYRMLAPGIGLDRIRSWGRPGSSFRIIGRQEQ
nr:hypothetical protein [Neorhizobium tomejilense]